MSPVPTVLDRIERIGLVSCKFPEIKTLPAWLLLFTPFLFFASIAYASNTEISVVDRRPNIIWIVVEDISPDLGAYGNAIVHTPNIDRLAVGGIRYTRAFSTSSVCSPSRSAFFTGMYQTSIGAHHHRSHIDDGYRLPAGVKLVTQYLRDAGYFTLLMGPKQKTDFNFTPHVEPFDADDGKQVISGGAYTHDPADKAILEGAAWQQYPGDRPFFAVVNYSEAHRDFTHDPVNPIDPNDVALPSYYPDHDIARRDWALYLETIQLLDRKIGNLMQELESHGALDNTIIMLFGDHGRAMLRDKQWLYDGGIHVPLVIWGNGIETGVVRDDLVSLIDLAPTTMDIAGLEVPGHMEGNIFLGENRRMREFIFAQRDRCDETDDRIRAVRDKRFKYIVNHIPGQPYLAFNAYKNLRYPVLPLMQKLHREGKLAAAQERFMTTSRPAEELYDTANDPDEVRNLAEDPKYRETLQRMRLSLGGWESETQDLGRIPESHDVTAYWDDFFRNHYRKNMASRGLSVDVSNDEYLDWWDKELKRMGK